MTTNDYMILKKRISAITGDKPSRHSSHSTSSNSLKKEWNDSWCRQCSKSNHRCNCGGR